MARLGGECDFVKDVAVWYPLHVIMMILGAPAEDEAFMLKLTQELFGSTDSEMRRDAHSSDLDATVKDMFAYFGALSAARRAQPRDDLASVIANATIDGKPLNDLDALSYYVIVATAGHDTTSASISGGLHGLLQHPEEFARLRLQPELLPGAVDEMIRWSSPVRHFFRTATRDYVLRGKTIRAGDALMMCYPSANQDEDVFEEPQRFKVDRAHGKHLAFGYGPHVCIGQYLARMELRALYAELLARVEHIELTAATRGVESSFVSGLKSLPIRYRMRDIACTPLSPGPSPASGRGESVRLSPLSRSRERGRGRGSSHNRSHPKKISVAAFIRLDLDAAVDGITVDHLLQHRCFLTSEHRNKTTIVRFESSDN